MILLGDPNTLRDLLAQFHRTANEARSLRAGAIIDALAVELQTKADVVEHLINLTTGTTARSS